MLGFGSSFTELQAVCGICKKENSKYTCPNCSITYCSLKCYKSENHYQCSENFYKKNVTEELRKHKKLQSNENELRDQKRLLGVLNKYNNDYDLQMSRSSDQEQHKEEWKYQLPETLREKAKSIERSIDCNDVAAGNRFAYDDSEDDDDRPLTEEEQKELEFLVNEASVEKLLSLLTPEQRKEFEIKIKNENYVVADID